MADTTTTTQQSGLSDWAAPYVSNYLGRAQALGDSDYQVYQGPLTADVSPLQLQSMAGISGLLQPGQFGAATDAASGAVGGIQSLGQFAPTQFGTGTFTPEMAQRYMNPYLQAALNPQLAEARRQSDVSRMQDDSRLTQAGAYGGSRQAIMDSERDRNLQTSLNNIMGAGYATAYDKAAGQFNTEQGRDLDAQRASEQSRQFGAGNDLAGYGLQLQGANTLGSLGTQEGTSDLARLRQLMDAGNTERGIESEGVNADHNEFLRQADFDYNNVNFMRDALSGLPVSSVSNTTPDASTMNQLIGLLIASQGMARGGRVKLARGGTVPGGLAELAISRMG